MVDLGVEELQSWTSWALPLRRAHGLEVSTCTAAWVAGPSSYQDDPASLRMVAFVRIAAVSPSE